MTPNNDPNNDNERLYEGATEAEAAPLSDEELEKKWGLRSPAQLDAYCASLPPARHYVDDLIRPQRTTVGIGDSHIGKTPFGYQVGITIAAGLDNFLGRKCHTKAGTRVVYLDCEGDPEDNRMMALKMSRHLGLTDTPPSFKAWNIASLNGADHSFIENWENWLQGFLRDARPEVLFIDPVTAIYTRFGNNDRKENYEFFVKLHRLEEEYKFAAVLWHHIRKNNAERGRHRLSDVTSSSQLNDWLQQAVGSNAITNGSDIRLGLDFCDDTPGADVLVKGFERGKKLFSPLYIKRHYSSDGDDDEPIAYGLLTSLDRLSASARKVWDQLPAEVDIPRKDLAPIIHGVTKVKSTKEEYAVIDELVSAGVFRRVKTGVYMKSLPGVETVAPPPPPTAPETVSFFEHLRIIWPWGKSDNVKIEETNPHSKFTDLPAWTQPGLKARLNAHGIAVPEEGWQQLEIEERVER